MAVKKKHYKSRSNDGREQTYNAPDVFLAKAYQYFSWCDNNPLLKKEAIKSGTMAGTIIDIPTQRPYLLTGLCVFCGISERTFREYETQKNFISVIEHIKEIVKQNQMEGASAGIYNASIISRILDTPDMQDITGLRNQSFMISVINTKTKEEIEDLKENLTKHSEI